MRLRDNTRLTHMSAKTIYLELMKQPNDKIRHQSARMLIRWARKGNQIIFGIMPVIATAMHQPICPNCRFVIQRGHHHYRCEKEMG